jgi:hypothetical protein
MIAQAKIDSVSDPMHISVFAAGQVLQKPFSSIEDMTKLADELGWFVMPREKEFLDKQLRRPGSKGWKGTPDVDFDELKARGFQQVAGWLRGNVGQ